MHRKDIYLNRIRVIAKSFIPAFLLLTLFSATAYAAFSSATRITNNTVFDNDVNLSIENNNLHLLIQQTSTAFAESGNLIYKMKTSAGWKSSVKIASKVHTGRTGMGGGQSIASYNGKAHVVYTINDGDDEIVYKTNKGGSWPTNPVRITTNTGVEDFMPVIANQAGKLYIVFVRQSGTGDTEIFFSQNLYGKWSAPRALTSNLVDDDMPHVVAKGGKVYVTWASMGFPNSSIKYRVLANGTWSPERTIISSKTKMYLAPQMTVVNGIPYVTYSEMDFDMTGEEFTLIGNIGFSYTDAGSWVHKKVTTNTTGAIADSGSIIANYGGKIRLAWFRYGETTPPDIVYGSLNMTTKNWTVSNITNTPSVSNDAASIVVDSNGKSHIVYTSGNQKPEVYYRKEQ